MCEFFHSVNFDCGFRYEVGRSVDLSVIAEDQRSEFFAAPYRCIYLLRCVYDLFDKLLVKTFRKQRVYIACYGQNHKIGILPRPYSDFADRVAF